MYYSLMNKTATRPRQPDTLLLDLLGAAHGLEARVEEAFAGVGLSWARYGVLEQLAQAGEALSLGELAARLTCVRSNMTQLVDKLEADGLVRRLADPADRRSVLAELTPQGRESQARGGEELRRVGAEFSAGLGRDGRTALQGLVATLAGRHPA